VNWRERKVQHAADRPDERRLSEARHALQQHVAACQQPGEHFTHDLFLANDNLADLGFRPERHFAESPSTLLRDVCIQYTDLLATAALRRAGFK